MREPDGKGDRFLADPIPTPHRDDHERRPLILKIYAPPGAAQELTVESDISMSTPVAASLAPGEQGGQSSGIAQRPGVTLSVS